MFSSYLSSQRIRYRIIVPFTLLFGIMTLLYGCLSVFFFSHYLDQDQDRQMKQVAGVIANTDFALNTAILWQLKKVTEADVLVVSKNGRLLNSTFSKKDAELATKLLFNQRVNRKTKNILLSEAEYRVSSYPLKLSAQREVLLSLWASVDSVSKLKNNIYIAVILIACCGIAAMSIAGFMIAKTITAPVEKLVVAADHIAEGNLDYRVPPTPEDEIGRLAQSFNYMVEQLKEYEKKLVDSEKIATAGQLAAGFAHEIRNPLTSIKMLGQTLQQRLKNQPENQQMIKSMVNEIDRLDRVIENVIVRTRPDDLLCKSNNLNQTLSEVLELVGPTLKAQGIRLETSFFTGDTEILIDAEKIKQVLWNLLLNAKDAMPDGGVCSVKTVLQEDGHVSITVSDTGHGIEDGRLEQIFTPFYTTKPEGMGLGLSMCRRIVQQHGGELRLLNGADGGVSAEMILPV